MRAISVLILLSTSVLTRQALAEARPVSEFQYFLDHPIKSDPDVSPSIIKMTEETLDEVDKMLEPESGRPELKSIKLISKKGGRGFAPLYEEIRLYSASFLKKANVAHEYGHAYFDVNIKIRGKSLKEARAAKEQKLRELVERQERRIDEIWAGNDRMNALKKEGKLKEAEELSQSLERLKAESKADKKEELALRAQLDVFVQSPYAEYNELFADSVAVLNADDPAAMRDALMISAATQSKIPKEWEPYIEARNFNDDPTRVVIPPEGLPGEMDPYLVFRKTRKFLSDNYFFGRNRFSNQTQLLSALLKVFGSEIEYRLDHPEELFTSAPELPPEGASQAELSQYQNRLKATMRENEGIADRINDRLINKIDKALKEKS